MLRLACLALMATQAAAEGERAGDFDYYILSLSWSAAYCATEGDARGDDQCDTRHDYSFTLHGLWPQYDSGWPSYCPTAARNPSRRETGEMTNIMGSSGLAWHQWQKHGRCTGLSSEDYFDLSRRAYASVTIPEVLRNLTRDVTLPASVVEEAFTEANPGLTPPMLTVACDQGMIREVRICLTKDLAFRPCGADAARDCRMQDALLKAVR